MNPKDQETIAIQEARWELDSLIDARDSRSRIGAVVGCSVCGMTGFVAMIMAESGFHGLFALAFFVLAGLYGAKVIPVNSQFVMLHRDRIAYLQSYLAAREQWSPGHR